MKRFACLLGLAPLLAPALAAQIFWIDPVRGVDRAGGGSANQPLRTLGFATRLANPSQPNAFLLRAGVYSTASGESFPIVLPDDCVVRRAPELAPGSRQVVIDAPFALSASFQWQPTGPGSLTLEGLVFRGGMFRSVQVQASGARTSLRVAVRDCRFAQSRCLAVNLDAGADAVFDVEACALTGPDVPLVLRASNGARLRLNLDRSLVEGGLVAGCWIDAPGSGQVQLHVRSSILRGAPRHGILIETGPTAGVLVRAEHVLFEDLGNQIVVGTVRGFGAIVEAGTGTPARIEVVNSVFQANRQDAPAGAQGNYLWGTNSVEQANLIGLGGNGTGGATFVDPTFHPSPGSAAIDRGDPADVTLPVDFHGVPRLGRPDLGPGEFWNELLFSRSDAVSSSGAVAVEYLTTSRPGLAFALWFDVAAQPGSFGAGQYHLGNVPVDFGLGGIVDARGIGRATLHVPRSIEVLGFELFAQAIYAQAPFLGVNAHRVVFTP